MAEGLLRHLYGDRYDVFSAGIQKTQVHPLAIQVLKEIGIDISRQRSKIIDEFKDATFDYVVTVCDHARETCPFFPGRTIVHQSFDDPSLVKGSVDTALVAFRKTRDDISRWIKGYF